MGTPSLEPTGSWLNAELTGIHEYTYWNMPVGIFAQALWYKLVGFSMLKMRALSMLFGLLALVSWFVIVSKLSGSRLAGSLAVGLLSIDYTFLWSAADGRMDMMCAGLGAAGIASYLWLRQSRWTLALWLANTCLALSLFTHPNGMLFVLCLVFLTVFYDRDQLSWRDLPALTPYFAIAALWGAYILHRPDYFLAQFGANATAFGGSRWAGLRDPLDALKSEIIIRYLAHYGIYPVWGGPIPKYTVAVPFLCWFSALAAWFVRPIRCSRGPLALLCLSVLFFSVMTLFVGMKSPSYLVIILPLYAAVLAVWLCMSHRRGSMPAAPMSAAVLLLLVACQLGTIAFKVRKNAYGSEYAPTVQFVRQHVPRRASLVADSYFGFDLGFDRVKDDTRLGYYTGVHPDVIIADVWYRYWWEQLFPVVEPEVAGYVRKLLSAEYRVIFAKGPFRVYERRPK